MHNIFFIRRRFPNKGKAVVTALAILMFVALLMGIALLLP